MCRNICRLLHDILEYFVKSLGTSLQLLPHLISFGIGLLSAQNTLIWGGKCNASLLVLEICPSCLPLVLVRQSICHDSLVPMRAKGTTGVLCPFPMLSTLRCISTPHVVFGSTLLLSGPWLRWSDIFPDWVMHIDWYMTVYVPVIILANLMDIYVYLSILANSNQASSSTLMTYYDLGRSISSVNSVMGCN